MTNERGTDTGNQILEWIKRKWLAILLVLVIVIVAIQNGLVTSDATVALLWARVTMPTWLLVALLFLIGALAGWMFARNMANRRGR